MADLEDDLIGTASLVTIVLLVVAIYVIWKWFQGHDPAQSFASLLRKAWNAVDSVFSGAMNKVSQVAAYGAGGLNQGEIGPGPQSPYDVVTGTSQGNNGPIAAYPQLGGVA